MFSKDTLDSIVKKVRHLKPDFTPVVGIILGSGLAPLADEIEQATFIPYKDLPGLPLSSVSGHVSQLVLGYLKGVPVACLRGRVHYYEGAKDEDIKMLVRLLKLLGCHQLLITNASGSLRKHIGAGELVLVNDHINFQGRNPLIGPNDDEFGDRFFPMDEAYDKVMREHLHSCAKALEINLFDGTYISVLGPNFETPAEIHAFRTWGADLVGMSTVPEVLVAKHCGLRVAVIATITNLSADLNEEPITHEGTLHYAQLASGKLRQLIAKYLETYKDALTI